MVNERSGIICSHSSQRKWQMSEARRCIKNTSHITENSRSSIVKPQIVCSLTVTIAICNHLACQNRLCRFFWDWGCIQASDNRKRASAGRDNWGRNNNKEMNKGDWEDWRRSVINCKSVLHASGIYVGNCKRRKFAGGRSGASISSCK